MKWTLVLAVAVLAARPAAAHHDVAAKTARVAIDLVPAFAPCVAPTLPRDWPPAGLGCSAVPLSNGPNALEFGPNGSGVSKVSVVPGGGDLLIDIRLRDVRRVSDGSPYTGNLTSTAMLRQTDDYCFGVLSDGCTMTDLPSPVPLPCEDGTCIAHTTANTIVAGSVVRGTRANVEAREIVVFDPDNNHFLVPGWAVTP